MLLMWRGIIVMLLMLMLFTPVTCCLFAHVRQEAMVNLRIDIRPNLCTSRRGSSTEKNCFSFGLSCNLGRVVVISGQHVVSAVGQKQPEHTMVHGIVLL